ncbi:2-hydroxyacid dehydrogenase [Roseomonas sp. 18066]|uniref:2-hydroxyacid dehydrogenase n=1 Tax=Roseomonas sp. 18066 TaxID=2681412 RepID=UPI00135BA867|nr:2-hydroxyacid dehydrogenase [Roseomonas sp. 18066]
MKPVILTAMPVPARLLTMLEPHVTVLPPLSAPVPEAVPPEGRDARVLITLGGIKTSAALIEALPQLGLICCYGTGYESVDRVAAAARGIKVTNAADANAAAVAEFAMGLALAATRDILRGDAWLRAGHWQNKAIERLPLARGLLGRRIGIFGLGAIGVEIATRARAFGMEVAYHNRRPRADLPYTYIDSLQGLAAWSDVLMVAVRASAQTEHAVSTTVLEALGPEGVLVNISRGSVVDEAALIAALDGQKIAGAALDVFEHEPKIPARLTEFPNVVLTPHIAALAVTAQHAQQQLMADNIFAYFAGQQLLSEVPAP